MTGPEERDLDPGPPAFEAIVSNPAPRPPGASSEPDPGSGAGLVYVSLPTGTVPNGEAATIEHRRSGARITVPVVLGGFDPVALSASPGDVLRIEVRVAGTPTPVTAEFVVPPRKRPLVVRTNPPPGKRDVPLNATLVVVFSEPVDTGTLTTASLQLLHDGVPVAGAVAVNPTTPWEATFSAAAPLEAETAYELAVTDQIRDLDGDQLEAEVRVPFTTQSRFLPRIAFVSTRDGPAAVPGPGSRPYIYLANADGSGVARLTEGDMPSWSWDGRRIVFERFWNDTWEIVVIDVDGSNERVLNRGGFGPAWSPDGTKIVFHGPVGNQGISVMNADGSSVTRLIGYEFGLPDAGYGPGWVGFPTWSPDGGSIAFVRTNYGIPSEVFIMNPDGSGVRSLGLPTSVGDSRPSWSPDGTRVLLQLPLWMIASVTLNGSDLRIHTEARYVGDPDWSPDGRRVVFAMFSAPGTASSPLGTQMRIFVTDTTTGTVRRLIPDALAPAQPDYWDYHVVWSRVRD